MHQQVLRSFRIQASAAFGLFTSSPFSTFSSASTRPAHQTSFLLRPPSPSAPREVPTPLVFLSATAWSNESGLGLEGMSAMYAERGYTCIEVDLGLPEREEDRASSTGLMRHFEKELSAHVRLAGIPFPPVLFSRSLGCLIAQTYISSHPASALVLLSPPPSTSAAATMSRDQSPLPTPLAEFTYEPRFPIVVVDTPAGMERQKQENRIVKEGVDTIEVERMEGQKALVAIEKWMDMIGI